MARITVVLDDIITLSGLSINGEPKPSKAAALCDLAGSGGVAIQIKSGDISNEYEKIIKSIREVLGIPLALIIPAVDKAIGKALDLMPSMVVLDGTVSGDNDCVARLQVANIIVAVTIAPDLDQVKGVAKLKADYIAIDVSQFCSERNLATRVEILNNISKAAALAERLSLGVILTGPMTLNDISKLSDIKQVEDFFVGHELIGKALLLGLEGAVSLFKKELGGE